jgi:serine/threonine protein kinase
LSRVKYENEKNVFCLKKDIDHIIDSKDNKYHIIRYLCRSGYGEVYLAITSDRYLVSLKLFDNKNHIDHFIENAKNVHRKMGEYFLPYVDYFISNIDNKKYYIMVMKYFEGWVLLSEYLNKNIFYEEQKIRIKTEIEKIIHRLHQISIVHNDINSENIVIHSKSNHVRIIDLGYCITRFEENLTEDEFEKLKNIDMDMLSSL